MPREIISAPVRDPDDNEPLNEGRLKNAPRGARRPVHDQRETDALIGFDVASPEPPSSTVPVFAAVRQLTSVIVVAAASAFGTLYCIQYFSGSALPQQVPRASDQANLASNLIANPSAAGLATSGLAPGSADDHALRATNGVTSVGAVQRSVPPGTELRSASTPSAPSPLTSALSAAASRSSVPQFKGQDSRDPASSRDNTVVDRTGPLDWPGKSIVAPAKSPPQPLDAAKIAQMMKSGADFMANGKIAAARMMFKYAAEAGEPAAALAIAETYDPLVLAKLDAKGGITPDVALAQTWYEKARELGSSAAQERLTRLTERSQ